MVFASRHQISADSKYSTAEALSEIAAGRFVVVTDDADRENEGDLIIAAAHMTPEKMHFMVRN